MGKRVEAARLAYRSGIAEVMPRFFVAADGESAVECTEHGCVARSARVDATGSSAQECRFPDIDSRTGQENQ